MKGYAKTSNYAKQGEAEILDKIDKWYKQKQAIGKEERYATLAKDNDSATDRLNDATDLLDELRKEIEVTAERYGFEVIINENGVSLKMKEISHGPDEQGLEPNESELGESSIENLRERLNNAGEEYGAASANALGNKEEKKQGTLEAVRERKLDLMQQDAGARKILQEVVAVQQAKDALDMATARHVVEKNKLMMQIQNYMLDLYQEVARGDVENNPRIEMLKQNIAECSNLVSAMENDFENQRAILASTFEASCVALEGAKKSFESDLKGEGNRNHYTTSMNYSEDGVFQGYSLDGKTDDRPIHVKEVFSEGGVMVQDSLQFLSGSVSINIDGQTVVINSNFTGNGHEMNEAAMIDGMVVAETNVGAGVSIVDEVPDIDEINPEEVAEEMVDDMAEYNTYMIDGEEYDSLPKIPEMYRRHVIEALRAAHLIKVIDSRNVLLPPSVALVADIIDQAIQRGLENDSPFIPQPGMPRPRPY